MSASPDKLTAVVLAGGYGTRLQGVLSDVPKPMAPICGRPFVEWVIRYLGKQGIAQTILSTGYLGDTIEAHFVSRPVPEMEVRCVREGNPLGTAGGFLNAICSVTEPAGGWLVVNGDSLVLAKLSELLKTLDSDDVVGAVLGIHVQDTSRYGTLYLDGDGSLKGFREKQPGNGIVNAGVYVFQPSVVEQFPDRVPLSFETDVFPALLESGARLKAVIEDAPFIDIGTPEMLAAAEDFIQKTRSAFL